MNTFVLETSLLVVMGVCLIILLLSFAVGSVFDGIGGDADVGTTGDSVSPMNLQTLLVFLIVGCAATYISVNQGLAWWYAFPIGGAFGVLAGFVVHKVLQGLVSQSGSSHWTIDDAKGREARVSVDIDPGHVGQVTLNMRGELASYSARSRGEGKILTGALVTVVSVDGGVLTVQEK